jgi:hypothetical protein
MGLRDLYQKLDRSHGLFLLHFEPYMVPLEEAGSNTYPGTVCTNRQIDEKKSMGFPTLVSPNYKSNISENLGQGQMSQYVTCHHDHGLFQPIPGSPNILKYIKST